MKRIIIYLLMCFLNVSVAYPREKEPSPRNEEWTGTAEQKLWGLMTIWAQTKFAFPHTERLREVDWDQEAQEFVSRVIAAKDIEGYYKLLMELVTQLRDSHTYVVPPWARLTPGYDMPP